MMSSREPLFISVIVPVYNAKETLLNCLTALTTQTYPPHCYEIIVVNNNSTDTSMVIAKGFSNVRIFEEKSAQSSYAARNLGIREAKGELIAFTDADCVVDSHWLEQLAQSFGKDSSIGGVAGETKAYNPKTIIELYQQTRKHLWPKFLSNSHSSVISPTCNVMYKASVLESVGCFNSTLISGGDYDLAYRILNKKSGKIVVNQEAIVFHKHRRGLKEFLKQYYRYGVGKRHLKEMGYERLRVESVFVYMVAGFFYSFLNTIRQITLCIIRRKKFYEIIFPWFEWLEGLALRFGFLRGI